MVFLKNWEETVPDHNLWWVNAEMGNSDQKWETLAQHRLVLELNFALLLPTTELSEEGGVRGD